MGMLLTMACLDAEAGSGGGLWHDDLSQQQNVKGRVVDEDDNPLPGVNVLVKGSTLGTVTDEEGSFSLSVPNADAVLVFSV